MAQGWSAIEVLGEPGEHPDPLGWERASFERALEAAGAAQVLVIGKSLASMFAAEVSERGLPAVWLTPLLSEASVIAGLARARRATLLVGGTADAAWRGDAIPDNPLLEALELPGVDHGDPARSPDITACRPDLGPTALFAQRSTTATPSPAELDAVMGALVRQLVNPG